MTLETLEKRLTSLERQVAELMSNGNGKEPVKDWRSTVRAFADDPLAQKVFKNVLKIREAERREARRSETRNRRIKK
jgi:hypothetical protein